MVWFHMKRVRSDLVGNGLMRGKFVAATLDARMTEDPNKGKGKGDGEQSGEENVDACDQGIEGMYDGKRVGDDKKGLRGGRVRHDLYIQNK